MAFTRPKYDDCYFRERVKQSNDNLNYALYRGQTATQDDCYPYSSLLQKHDRNFNKFGNSEEAGRLADIESLIGPRGDYFSTCMVGRTMDDKNRKLYQVAAGGEAQHSMQSVSACNNRFLETHDTSLFLPKHDVKELDVFEYRHQDLYLNPQCNIYWNDSLNSRNFSKDTYIEPTVEIIVDEDNIKDSSVAKRERFVHPGLYDMLGQTALPREYYHGNEFKYKDNKRQFRDREEVVFVNREGRDRYGAVQRNSGAGAEVPPQ